MISITCVDINGFTTMERNNRYYVKAAHHEAYRRYPITPERMSLLARYLEGPDIRTRGLIEISDLEIRAMTIGAW